MHLQTRPWLLGVSVALLVVSLVPPGRLVAQEPFASIGSVHFKIRYQQGVSEGEVRQLLDFLQAEREAVLRQVAVDSVKKIEVRIYNSVGRFLSGAGVKQAWRGAFYAKDVIHLQPISALVQRGILEESVRYELAHALLESAGRKGCPLWLRDSYAVFFSGEMSRLSPVAGVRLTSFADLNQDIQQYPNPPQRGDVHYVLGQTMQFFVDRYGEQKAMGVFREFDGTKSAETLFKVYFGEEYSVLEHAWADKVQTLSRQQR